MQIFINPIIGFLLNGMSNDLWSGLSWQVVVIRYVRVVRRYRRLLLPGQVVKMKMGRSPSIHPKDITHARAKDTDEKIPHMPEQKITFLRGTFVDNLLCRTFVKHFAGAFGRAFVDHFCVEYLSTIFVWNICQTFCVEHLVAHWSFILTNIFVWNV